MATIPIVNIIDRRNGAIAAVVAMILLFLYLILTTFQMADPPPRIIELPVETEFPEELNIENLRVMGGSTSGSPNDKDVTDPKETMEYVLTGTNPNTATASGQASNSTPNPNPNNPDNNIKPSDNPFDPGGVNGAVGAGATEGEEGPLVGTEGGASPPAKRKRIKDVDSKSIESNENARITLILTVDAQGNVTKAYCNTAGSTTTNQILINRVIYAVKKQVKYNKAPGSKPVKISLVVDVKPS
jgi:hypothetical protein